jgi:hypothetical protein
VTPPTLFVALAADWARIERSQATLAALRRWQDCEPALAGLATMADLVAEVEQRGCPARSDAMLAVLARLAADDDLAARTLLQLLLPGAKALCRRLWWLGDQEERAAAVVGALYERIRTYPWQRRPARIAANLLADTGQQLRRAARHRLAEVPLPELAEEALPDSRAGSASEATEELVELLGWAATSGALSRAQVRLIGQTRVADTPFHELGRLEGLGAHTIRRRRQRAERQLAAALASPSHGAPCRVLGCECA